MQKILNDAQKTFSFLCEQSVLKWSVETLVDEIQRLVPVKPGSSIED